MQATQATACTAAHSMYTCTCSVCGHDNVLHSSRYSIYCTYTHHMCGSPAEDQCSVLPIHPVQGRRGEGGGRREEGEGGKESEGRGKRDACY